MCSPIRPERIPARGGMRIHFRCAGGSKRRDRYSMWRGGASVYRQLLPLCRTAWITQVDADGGGDQFLADLDRNPDWRLAEASEWKKLAGPALSVLPLSESVLKGARPGSAPL